MFIRKKKATKRKRSTSSSYPRRVYYKNSAGRPVAGRPFVRTSDILRQQPVYKSIMKHLQPYDRAQFRTAIGKKVPQAQRGELYKNNRNLQLQKKLFGEKYRLFQRTQPAHWAYDQRSSDLYHATPATGGLYLRTGRGWSFNRVRSGGRPAGRRGGYAMPRD